MYVFVYLFGRLTGLKYCSRRKSRRRRVVVVVVVVVTTIESCAGRAVDVIVIAIVSAA